MRPSKSVKVLRLCKRLLELTLWTMGKERQGWPNDTSGQHTVTLLVRIPGDNFENRKTEFATRSGSSEGRPECFHHITYFRSYNVACIWKLVYTTDPLTRKQLFRNITVCVSTTACWKSSLGLSTRRRSPSLVVYRSKLGMPVVGAPNW